MKVEWPKSGHYVVAVSGGVDSMSLLHMLHNRPDYKLTVAHFDHGIREDSAEDRQFVEAVAKLYGRPFVYAEGDLGYGASEAEARNARYKFLKSVRRANRADAIITAHHQNDLLETAILNMLRGTGRRGLTSLSSGNELVRPLLKVSKEEILDYAVANSLDWRDDATNQDISYFRNYIRHRLLPRFSQADKSKLTSIISEMQLTNQRLDDLLVDELRHQSQMDKLDRAWFNHLPHDVAREVLATWLRTNQAGYDRKSLERLVVAAKTAKPGKKFPVAKEVQLSVAPRHLALVYKER